MAKVKRRRFESSVFLALFVVALIPTALVVSAGAWAVRDTLQRSGSAGPWEEVAASGDALAGQVTRSWPADEPLPESVTSAIASHRQVLEDSAEMSRLFAAVSARALARLPLLVGLLGAFAMLLAWVGARLLSRGFARPIGELVEWTGRIARGEPLPEPVGDARGMEELAVLGTALRSLSSEVVEGRARAVEAARLSTWSAVARRVAHEIKNPLTPMKMAARQLHASAGSEAGREAAEVMLEEVERLDTLARTFVQVGTAPEGPPAPVDLVELVHGLVRPFEGGPVSIVVSARGEPSLVHGHLDALRSALRNLLTNAVEACEHGREPEDHPPLVTVTVCEESGPHGSDGVRVTVEDDGIGIPAGLESSIWNLDVTTKRRGSGIGLPLVRQTALAHGGTVEAANRPERGARFSIWVPLRAQEEEPDRKGSLDS